MPTVVLSVTGTLSDIQAAQANILNAISSAGCTLVLPVRSVQVATVNSLAAITSQPLTISAIITAPANSNFQTLITNLQTVKTGSPNLTFSLTYTETGAV